MREKLIERLKQINIVQKVTVTLKSAGKSDFYVDVKKAYGCPDALSLIADELWKIMPKNITCIAAAGYGGLPPASVISSRHGLKLTLVRDEQKKHGLGGWIDGYLPTKLDKVVVVDDVFTTGGSLRKTIEALKPTGAEIPGCYVVAKRSEGNFETLLEYILTPDDLF